MQVLALTLLTLASLAIATTPAQSVATLSVPGASPKPDAKTRTLTSAPVATKSRKIGAWPIDISTGIRRIKSVVVVADT
ncbi:hypothetical protein P280DRAFT_474568 [Massarina eburnea CBS 473.64]|uniref:Uncharacterized protein n=1 Tax=Massarina eburnea CBS 473.64 TaxID=1395130 RepID=A0A6A6RKH2_9PLEO|nr:hypothetical protein P280DRAFT_474568 [Massarina eburnea CBS 473.64]